MKKPAGKTATHRPQVYFSAEDAAKLIERIIKICKKRIDSWIDGNTELRRIQSFNSSTERRLDELESAVAALKRRLPTEDIDETVEKVANCIARRLLSEGDE